MSTVERILQHDIDGLPDRQFSLERVHYVAGEIDVAHHHTAPLVVYVVDGALRSRVGDAPERVYHAGECFYEAANAIHHVSANASTTEPVTFIVVFVAPRDATLTVPEDTS